jgi:hypothetical protein
MSILLIEYLSESKKLSRGTYTDTVSPFVWSEVTTWPSSIFVATWQGYPERFKRSAWQQSLNDALPSHLWAAVVQAILAFLIITGLGTASGLTRAARKRISS